MWLLQLSVFAGRDQHGAEMGARGAGRPHVAPLQGVPELLELRSQHRDVGVRQLVDAPLDAAARQQLHDDDELERVLLRHVGDTARPVGRDVDESLDSQLGDRVAHWRDAHAQSGFTGPGSPSVLANMFVSIEQHVDWVADAIAHLDANGLAAIEPTLAAQEAWVDHVNTCLAGLRSSFRTPAASVSTAKKCDEVAAKGYEGFVLSV